MREVDQRRRSSGIAFLLRQQDVGAVRPNGSLRQREGKERDAEQLRARLAHGQHGRAGRQRDAQQDAGEPPRGHEPRGRKPDERPRSRQQRGEREVHAVLQLGQPEERDVHVRTDGDVRHERQVVQPDDAQERREPLVARHRAQLLHASQHGALVAFAGGKRLVEQQRQPGA